MSYQIWEPQFEPPAPEGQPGPAGRVVAGTVGETSAAGDDGMGLLPGASQAAGSGASDAAGSGYGVTALFRAHHAELIRLAALMTGDRASGEDIVQDVFARLCARDRLPDPDGALAYVRAAVLNGCRSALRRRAVARRFGITRDALAADVTHRSAESEALLAEDRRQVLAGLAGLSRRRREVLVLRYWLGLPEAEIAAVLGISPGTVKSTAARGIAALARQLGEPA
jgi:RNA polymerase sigma-70 factor (sigma-E family)